MFIYRLGGSFTKSLSSHLFSRHIISKSFHHKFYFPVFQLFFFCPPVIITASLRLTCKFSRFILSCEVEIWTWPLQSLQFSCSVISDSLWPHGLHHARLPCPSPIPRAYPNSCPLSKWCHPTISTVPFSSRLQSFPASGSFPVRRFFTPGGQSIRVSASVLLMNIQDWFPLGWTGWISLQSKELSRVFSNTTSSKASILRHSAFFIVQLSHPYMTTGKTIALIVESLFTYFCLFSSFFFFSFLFLFFLCWPCQTVIFPHAMFYYTDILESNFTDSSILLTLPKPQLLCGKLNYAFCYSGPCVMFSSWLWAGPETCCN